MAEHQIDDPLFDYKIYRFGRTRQVFRGPQPDLRGRYFAFIGGSSTFGRYAEMPYPDLIGQETGQTVLNLGTDGAGPGFFLGDPEVLRTAMDAELTVVQVMCATATSNRMFAVRPRRNLRLHTISDLLAGIYPEVDFSRFSFTKGMLKHLYTLDETRFKLVANEMKNAWIGRMQTLLSTIETKTLLFYMSERDPDNMSTPSGDITDMKYPQFVDRAMLDAVKPAADGYMECITSDGLPQDLRVDGHPVLFRPSGEPINENFEFASPEMHQAAAQALLPEIERLVNL
ncbi:MAG: DUF6473 family protein [Pseudomonadota bacterium]